MYFCPLSLFLFSVLFQPKKDLVYGSTVGYTPLFIVLSSQESMANTFEFVPALKTSLWTIWISYSVLGGLALLIFQQNGPVPDNIMKELPESSPAQEPLL